MSEQRLMPVTLVEPLRAGTQAAVWLATTPSGSRVAAKVARHADADAVTSLRREAAAQARCAGPHVLKVLAVQEERDRVLLIMPLAAHSLDDRLRSGGPLARAELRSLARGLLAAIEQCHRAGMVHADIKPENVLFVDDAWQLADFGVAVDQDRSRPDDEVVGSAPWLDPTSAPNAPARDRWALAVLLVEAATGELPFDAASPAAVQELARQGLAQPVVLPKDPALGALLTSALDPAVDHRPTEADWHRVLAQPTPTSGIRRVRATQGFGPAGTNRWQRTARRTRRPAALVAAGAMIGATVTALGIAVNAGITPGG